MALYHSFTLPWTYIKEEVERLKRLVVVFVAATAILGLIIPFIPVPKEDKTKEEKLPPRLAQLVMQQKQKPKPPPPKKVEKKKEKKKEEKKEKKKEKKKEPKKKKEVKKEPPKKTEAQKRAEARKKAQQSGLLAFADELADLRDKKVDQTLKKSKQLTKGGAEAKEFKRSVLTSNKVATGSGGINTAALSKGIGGGTTLEGRETTQVSSGIEEVAKANQGKVSGGSSGHARTYEEVSIVFDKNKGSIYALYNRELRKDPTIAGKIVFELTIAADGSVVDVKIESSELNSPKLEKKLMIKIKSFLFKPIDGGETLIVTYPLDFVPA